MNPIRASCRNFLQSPARNAGAAGRARVAGGLLRWRTISHVVVNTQAVSCSPPPISPEPGVTVFRPCHRFAEARPEGRGTRPVTRFAFPLFRFSALSPPRVPRSLDRAIDFAEARPEGRGTRRLVHTTRPRWSILDLSALRTETQRQRATFSAPRRLVEGIPRVAEHP